MWILIRPFRLLAQALTAEDAPRQLALGFAFGLVVGLAPKGNLTAIALMTILCAVRVNLAAGMLSAFVFSWVGVLTDPLTHKVGLWLLEAEMLTPMWTAFYNMPVVPWTAFNNTVVLGSLVVGLIFAWPLYRAVLPLFEKYTPVLQERLRRLKVAKSLTGAELAGRLGA